MDSAEANKQWFADQLARIKRSQNDLGRATGIERSRLSRCLAGSLKFRQEEIEAISRFFGVPISEVLRHAETKGLSAGDKEIALTGNINESGKVETLKTPRALPESVLVRAQAAVTGRHYGLTAAQVRAHKGALSIWDDFVLVFEDTGEVQPEAVGVLSIIKLRDGVQMLGHVEKARKTGEAVIRMANGETKEVALQSAAPILAAVP